MIARLRRRHRWTVTVLAIVVPALFVWAMLARRAVPVAPRPPPGAEPSHAEGRP